MDYDSTEIPAAYDRTRDHGPEFLELWMNHLEPYVDRSQTGTILDLGCGTGRFADALAARFEATVIGVDPSQRMLETSAPEATWSRPLRARCGRGHSASQRLRQRDFHLYGFPSLPRSPQGYAGVPANPGRERPQYSSEREVATAFPGYPYVPFFPSSRQLLEGASS